MDVSGLLREVDDPIPPSRDTNTRVLEISDHQSCKLVVILPRLISCLDQLDNGMRGIKEILSGAIWKV